jgi:4-hydroxy-tetrahydrodipicolinate reductase
VTDAAIFGFGALGRALARAIEASGLFRIAAVCDTDPDLAGRSVRTLLPGGLSEAVVTPTLPPAAAAGGVLFHASTSAPADTTRQVLAGLAAGYWVVSAAEWLFHPWLRHATEAAALDAAARDRGARVLGCGINPGFSFETLPVLLSRTMPRVGALRILRVANVGGVGPADFAHLGFGLTEAAFSDAVLSGAIEGHMGFPESVAALAACVGLDIDTITDDLTPTLAVAPIVLSHRTVAVGEVAGITQVATGSLGGQATIVMTLEMFLDPPAYGRVPREAITLDGTRRLEVTLQPAAPSADGAAAMMVHAAAALATVPPGLVSLLDLPMSGGRLSRGLRAGPAQRGRGGTRLATLMPPAGT